MTGISRFQDWLLHLAAILPQVSRGVKQDPATAILNMASPVPRTPLLALQARVIVKGSA